jgi:hypothetical protein
MSKVHLIDEDGAKAVVLRHLDKMTEAAVNEAAIQFLRGRWEINLLPNMRPGEWYFVNLEGQVTDGPLPYDQPSQDEEHLSSIQIVPWESLWSRFNRLVRRIYSHIRRLFSRSR